jgi:hypothetical protein
MPQTLIAISPDELRDMIRDAVREATAPKADELLRTVQVAEILGVSHRTAFNRCKRGGLTNYGTDASPRWRRGDVETLTRRKAG